MTDYEYKDINGVRHRRATDGSSGWQMAPADSGSSSKSTETLGKEMMGGKKVTGPAGMADMTDAEIEKMPDGLGKDLARRKAKAQREAKANVVAGAGKTGG